MSVTPARACQLFKLISNPGTLNTGSTSRGGILGQKDTRVTLVTLVSFALVISKSVHFKLLFQHAKV
jgi:hypothetical protein